MKDLVVLVADRNTEAVVKTLLEKRQNALSIQVQSFDIRVHPHHDPGVYRSAAVFLRPFASQYRYALVLFDLDGSGAEGDAAQSEAKVQQDLDQVGWSGRSAAIAIDPELEAWVFGGSRHVVRELAGGDVKRYNTILAKYGAAPPHFPKPDRPKEAMKELLRTEGRPRSSAIYARLAEKVSLKSCGDRAFLRLRHVLQQWFG